MENTTPSEKFMAEVAFNLQTLVQHTLDNVVKPPRGNIKEVGHYRVLNKKLSSKEFDALGQVLDELAYNVTSTLLATLDGTIESEIPDFPKVSLIEEHSQARLAESLQQAFVDVWEE